jgi:hypothetical protein
MFINDIIWLKDVVDKIAARREVETDEVEEVFLNKPKFKRAESAKYAGEDLYYAYGRTDSGRYLLVIFIYKKLALR